MATELAQGYVSLSVGFDGKPGRQIEEFLGRAQKATGRAGQEMGRALSSGVASGVEKAKANTASAQKAFEAAEKAAQKASQSQGNAARQVQIAEAKATEARQRYAAGSSQVLAAEDRLERAKQRAAKADLDLAAAEKRRGDASDKVKVALAEQTAAEEKSASKSERSAGKIRTVFSKLGAKLSNPFRGLPADADEAGEKSGKKFTEGFKSHGPSFGAMFKASFLGNAASSAITSSIGLIKQSLSSGFDRLSSIDQATQTLQGLGNTGKQTAQIMDNALASVKGTAFGMGDAATVAASAVAAGIKPGQQLQHTLSLVADAASVTNSSLDDMGSIFSKVATSGKMQGDEIQQLSDRGIPIVSLLSKSLHKTSAEVYAMSSKGQINFAMFQKAMEQGVGGAAKSSGNTFTGAMDNVRAAIGRLGASMEEGAFKQVPGAMKGLTSQIDNLGPVAEAAGVKVSAGFSSMLKFVQQVTDVWVGWWTGRGTDVETSWSEPLGEIAGVAQRTFTTLKQAVDVFVGWWTGRGTDVETSWSEPLGEAAASIKLFFEKVKSAAAGVIATFGPLALSAAKVAGMAAFGAVVAVVQALTPVMSALGKSLREHPELWRTMAVAVGSFVLALKGMSIAKTAFGAVSSGIKAVGAAMSANPIGLAIAAVAALAAGFIYAYKHSEKFRNIVNGALNGVKNVALAVGRWFSGPFVNFFKSGFDSVKKAATAVKNGIVSVFTAVKNAGVAIGRWFSGPFVHFFSDGFNAVKNGVMSLWHSVTSRFDAIRNGVSHTVSAMWTTVKRTFSNGRNDVVGIATMLRDGVMRIFNRLKSGVVNVFTAMRDTVKKVWNGIRDVIKNPIKWVIDTPINKGLISAVAKVQQFFGVKNTIQPIKLAGFRSGGVIPGAFDPRNRDNVLAVSSSGVPTARVEPGEFVVNRAQTARNLPLLHAINSGLVGYAGGGLVGGPGRWSKEFERRMMLVAASLGATLRIAQRGFRPRTPWSGTSHRGDAVDVAGGANLWSIRDALRRQGIAAWVRGPAQNYSWHVHGIPMPGAGVALGSAVYQQQAYAAGGDGLHGLTGKDPYARADNRFGWVGRAVHAVTSWADQMVEKAKNAFGGLADPMAFLRSKVGGMVNQITGRFGAGGWASTLAAIPGHLVSDATSWAKRLWDKMSSDGGDGGPAGSPGNLESWRPMVARALAASGIGGGKADEDKWLRQIKTESDGNPRLVQSSRVYDVNIAHGDPARGLVQVPKVTWSDFGRDMGSFIPNVYNPYKNLIVGMRAANAQHHNWRRVIGFGHGYQDGGIVPRNEIAALSEDGRPELVVGPQMRKLNARSQVFNADQTQQMMGWTRQPTTFNLYDRDDRLLGSMYGMAVDAIADHSEQLARMGAR